jgi:multicomponent K+:H+ antiporter subunit G
MTHAGDLPGWAALLTALFVLAGAALTLTGSLGLLRLGSFYDRVHAPTLGTTLGTGCVLIGSIICFSVLQTRPVLHEVLIAVFVTVTTPVTLTLLVRAALYRDRSENAAGVPAADASEREPSTVEETV